jgi:hypothetical protein
MVIGGIHAVDMQHFVQDMYCPVEDGGDTLDCVCADLMSIRNDGVDPWARENIDPLLEELDAYIDEIHALWGFDNVEE